MYQWPWGANKWRHDMEGVYNFVPNEMNTIRDELIIFSILRDVIKVRSFTWNLNIFQLILSPFIIRSQRNYKEGLLFSVAALSCIFVWIGWVTSYILLADNLGSHWHDIAVCCGLVVTPTLINLIVFVPKVISKTDSTIKYSRHRT